MAYNNTIIHVLMTSAVKLFIFRWLSTIQSFMFLLLTTI
jgi:hypothetical protein